ncbi:MAG: O-antigen ligase family protein [Patescibacteria group bacterium]|nr:O-antigen ligase family protein [Patescibacteria group bacterium]
MTLTIIRYFYYLLVVLVPLIVYSGTSELFEFNKMLYIYFTALCVGFLWLYYQIETGTVVIRRHWLFIPFGIFLATQILSTVFSIDRHTSIFGYYGRFNGGLFSLMCYATLAFVFTQIADRKFIRRFLQVSFATAVFVVLIGLPGRYGFDTLCLVFTGQLTNACWTDQFRPAERMFSTLGQPNWLGAYLAIGMCIGIALSFGKNLRNRYLHFGYAAGIVVCFLGILFTRSRSALLAAAVALAVIGVVAVLRHRRLVRERARILGGILFAIILSVLFFRTGSAQIDQYLTFQKPATSQTAGQKQTGTPAAVSAPARVTDSFEIRKIVWEGAIELGKRYPLFGTGVETFAYAYYFTRPAAHNATSEWDFLYNKAHNEFLNYLATTGFTGLIAYVGLILGSFIVLGKRYLAASDQSEKMFWAALAAGYGTITITNFFGFSVSSVQVFFYLLPVIGVVSAPHLAVSKSELPAMGWFRTASKVSVGMCILFGIIYLARYFFADVSYASAESLNRAGEYQAAFEEYNTALNLRHEHVYEDKLSSNLANLAFLLAYGDDTELSSHLKEQSEALNARALAQSPYNVLYWRTRAKNSYLFYQITLDRSYLDRSIASMERAQELAPTDPKMPYSTALFYSLAADEETDASRAAELRDLAKAQTARALQLKPDYVDAQELESSIRSATAASDIYDQEEAGM